MQMFWWEQSRPTDKEAAVCHTHMRTRAEITVIFIIAETQLIHLISREDHERFFFSQLVFFSISEKVNYGISKCYSETAHSSHTQEKRRDPEVHQPSGEVCCSFCRSVEWCQYSRAVSLHHFKYGLWASSFGAGTGEKGALSLEHFQHVENWHMGKRYRSRAEEGNKR